jgi:proton glutamate symport protein
LTTLAQIGRWARNPWVLLGSVALGVGIGLRVPELAGRLAPWGEIYLGLLKMCVLPVLITALTSAVARAVGDRMGGRYLRRLLAVFGLGLATAAALGVAFGSGLEPGSALDRGERSLLGAYVLDAEAAPGPRPEAGARGLLAFVRSLIPENVFQAAASGGSLPLVFFCIVMGLGLGSLRDDRGTTALKVLEAGYEALLRIVDWIMYALPVGLTCLVAERMATTGGGLILAMGWFVLALYAGALVLVLVAGLAIWSRVGGTPAAVLASLKSPLMVGLGTSSNFATIPSALAAVSAGLGRDRSGVNLVIPLGVNLFLPGSVLYFALASLFVAQLYGTGLEWQDYVVVAMASIFAAIAASDAPGIAGIGAVAVVLDQLGLPVDVAVILLSAVDPLVEPVITVADVNGNCMAAALVVDAADPGASALTGGAGGSDA